MWILDSAFRGGGMDLWHKDGTVQRIHHEYDPPFYLHLPDPDLHHGMIEALEEQYRAEPCTFTTIFGEHEGYAVFAGRPVAEAIEQQTQFAAQLFNVDVRRDQRFMAEQGVVPCCADPRRTGSPRTSTTAWAAWRSGSVMTRPETRPAPLSKSSAANAPSSCTVRSGTCSLLSSGSFLHLTRT